MLWENVRSCFGKFNPLMHNVPKWSDTLSKLHFYRVKIAFTLSYRFGNQFQNLQRLPNDIFTKVNNFVAKALITSSILFQIWMSHRPGWERRAIALTWPNSRHNKNTNVVCRTLKTLNSTLSRFFLIHSFSTLSIIFFTITLCKWTVWLY